jgi:predicted dehydrogenase
MDYGDFDVTLCHSKVSQTMLPSEIQGEDASLIIEKMSECQQIILAPRGADKQDLTEPQRSNTMFYEVEHFASLVENGTVDHAGLALSRSTARLLTEIRRQTGVVFPADNPDGPPAT